MKVAETVAAALMVTEHGEVEQLAPENPPNVLPEEAVAVRTTTVPEV